MCGQVSECFYCMAGDDADFLKCFNREYRVNYRHSYNESIKPNNFVNFFKDNFVMSEENLSAHDAFNEVMRGKFCDQIIELQVFDIEKALHGLKKSDARDYNELTIMHIMYAHLVVMLLLKLLFNAMLKHGICPVDFGHNVIIPILKNAYKSSADSSNYRPINVIPVVSKIFEACINVLLESHFVFDDNQFGFVKEGECSNAIYAVTSCFDYFIERDSDIFFASLDAVKAFDRVNHYFVASCMIEKGFPLQLVRIFES